MQRQRSFHAEAAGMYGWLVCRLQNDKVNNILYGLYSPEKLPPRSGWVFLAADREGISKSAEFTRSHDDDSLPNDEEEVFGKGMMDWELKLAMKQDIAVTDEYIYDDRNPDAPPTRYYALSGCPVKQVNGRYLQHGWYEGAPCYRNVRSWVLIRCKLQEIPEMGINAAESYALQAGEVLGETFHEIAAEAYHDILTDPSIKEGTHKFKKRFISISRAGNRMVTADQTLQMDSINNQRAELRANISRNLLSQLSAVKITDDVEDTGAGRTTQAEHDVPVPVMTLPSQKKTTTMTNAAGGEVMLSSSSAPYLTQSQSLAFDGKSSISTAVESTSMKESTSLEKTNAILPDHFHLSRSLQQSEFGSDAVNEEQQLLLLSENSADNLNATNGTMYSSTFKASDGSIVQQPIIVIDEEDEENENDSQNHEQKQLNPLTDEMHDELSTTSKPRPAETELEITLTLSKRINYQHGSQGYMQYEGLNRTRDFALNDIAAEDESVVSLSKISPTKRVEMKQEEAFIGAESELAKEVVLCIEAREAALDALKVEAAKLQKLYMNDTEGAVGGAVSTGMNSPLDTSRKPTVTGSVTTPPLSPFAAGSSLSPRPASSGMIAQSPAALSRSNARRNRLLLSRANSSRFDLRTWAVDDQETLLGKLLEKIHVVRRRTVEFSDAYGAWVRLLHRKQQLKRQREHRKIKQQSAVGNVARSQRKYCVLVAQRSAQELYAESKEINSSVKKFRRGREPVKYAVETKFIGLYDTREEAVDAFNQAFARIPPEYLLLSDIEAENKMIISLRSCGNHYWIRSTGVPKDTPCEQCALKDQLTQLKEQQLPDVYEDEIIGQFLWKDYNYVEKLWHDLDFLAEVQYLRKMFPDEDFTANPLILSNRVIQQLMQTVQQGNKTSSSSNGKLKNNNRQSLSKQQQVKESKTMLSATAPAVVTQLISGSNRKNGTDPLAQLQGKKELLRDAKKSGTQQVEKLKQLKYNATLRDSPYFYESKAQRQRTDAALDAALISSSTFDTTELNKQLLNTTFKGLATTAAVENRRSLPKTDGIPMTIYSSDYHLDDGQQNDNPQQQLHGSYSQHFEGEDSLASQLSLDSHVNVNQRKVSNGKARHSSSAPGSADVQRVVRRKKVSLPIEYGAHLVEKIEQKALAATLNGEDKKKEPPSALSAAGRKSLMYNRTASTSLLADEEILREKKTQNGITSAKEFLSLTAELDAQLRGKEQHRQLTLEEEEFSESHTQQRNQRLARTLHIIGQCPITSNKLRTDPSSEVDTSTAATSHAIAVVPDNPITLTSGIPLATTLNDFLHQNRTIFKKEQKRNQPQLSIVEAFYGYRGAHISMLQQRTAVAHRVPETFCRSDVGEWAGLTKGRAMRAFEFQENLFIEGKRKEEERKRMQSLLRDATSVDIIDCNVPYIKRLIEEANSIRGSVLTLDIAQAEIFLRQYAAVCKYALRGQSIFRGNRDRKRVAAIRIAIIEAQKKYRQTEIEATALAPAVVSQLLDHCVDQYVKEAVRPVYQCTVNMSGIFCMVRIRRKIITSRKPIDEANLCLSCQTKSVVQVYRPGSQSYESRRTPCTCQFISSKEMWEIRLFNPLTVQTATTLVSTAEVKDVLLCIQEANQWLRDPEVVCPQFDPDMKSRNRTVADDPFRALGNLAPLFGFGGDDAFNGRRIDRSYSMAMLCAAVESAVLPRLPLVLNSTISDYINRSKGSCSYLSGEPQWFTTTATGTAAARKFDKYLYSQGDDLLKPAWEWHPLREMQQANMVVQREEKLSKRLAVVAEEANQQVENCQHVYLRDCSELDQLQMVYEDAFGVLLRTDEAVILADRRIKEVMQFSKQLLREVTAEEEQLQLNKKQSYDVFEDGSAWEGLNQKRKLVKLYREQLADYDEKMECFLQLYDRFYSTRLTLAEAKRLKKEAEDTYKQHFPRIAQSKAVATAIRTHTRTAVTALLSTYTMPRRVAVPDDSILLKDGMRKHKQFTVGRRIQTKSHWDLMYLRDPYERIRKEYRNALSVLVKKAVVLRPQQQRILDGRIKNYIRAVIVVYLDEITGNYIIHVGQEESPAEEAYQHVDMEIDKAEFSDLTQHAMDNDIVLRPDDVVKMLASPINVAESQARRPSALISSNRGSGNHMDDFVLPSLIPRTLDFVKPHPSRSERLNKLPPTYSKRRAAKENSQVETARQLIKYLRLQPHTGRPCIGLLHFQRRIEYALKHVCKGQWFIDLMNGNPLLTINHIEKRYHIVLDNMTIVRIYHPALDRFEIQVQLPYARDVRFLNTIVPTHSIIESLHGQPLLLCSFLWELVTNSFSSQLLKQILQHIDWEIPGQLGAHYWRRCFRHEQPRPRYLEQPEQRYRGPIFQTHRFVSGQYFRAQLFASAYGDLRVKLMHPTDGKFFLHQYQGDELFINISRDELRVLVAKMAISSPLVSRELRGTMKLLHSNYLDKLFFMLLEVVHLNISSITPHNSTIHKGDEHHHHHHHYHHHGGAPEDDVADEPDFTTEAGKLPLSSPTDPNAEVYVAVDLDNLQTKVKTLFRRFNNWVKQRSLKHLHPLREASLIHMQKLIKDYGIGIDDYFDDSNETMSDTRQTYSIMTKRDKNNKQEVRVYHSVSSFFDVKKYYGDEVKQYTLKRINHSMQTHHGITGQTMRAILTSNSDDKEVDRRVRSRRGRQQRTSESSVEDFPCYSPGTPYNTMMNVHVLTDTSKSKLLVDVTPMDMKHHDVVKTIINYEQHMMALEDKHSRSVSEQRKERQLQIAIGKRLQTLNEELNTVLLPKRSRIESAIDRSLRTFRNILKQYHDARQNIDQQHTEMVVNCAAAAMRIVASSGSDIAVGEVLQADTIPSTSTFAACELHVPLSFRKDQFWQKWVQYLNNDLIVTQRNLRLSSNEQHLLMHLTHPIVAAVVTHTSKFDNVVSHKQQLHTTASLPRQVAFTAHEFSSALRIGSEGVGSGRLGFRDFRIWQRAKYDGHLTQQRNAEQRKQKDQQKYYIKQKQQQDFKMPVLLSKEKYQPNIINVPATTTSIPVSKLLHGRRIFKFSSRLMNDSVDDQSIEDDSSMSFATNGKYRLVVTHIQKYHHGVMGFSAMNLSNQTRCYFYAYHVNDTESQHESFHSNSSDGISSSTPSEPTNKMIVVDSVSSLIRVNATYIVNQVVTEARNALQWRSLQQTLSIQCDAIDEAISRISKEIDETHQHQQRLVRRQQSVEDEELRLKYIEEAERSKLVLPEGPTPPHTVAYAMNTTTVVKSKETTGGLEQQEEERSSNHYSNILHRSFDNSNFYHSSAITKTLPPRHHIRRRSNSVAVIPITASSSKGTEATTRYHVVGINNLNENVSALAVPMADDAQQRNEQDQDEQQKNEIFGYQPPQEMQLVTLGGASVSSNKEIEHVSVSSGSNDPYSSALGALVAAAPVPATSDGDVVDEADPHNIAVYGYYIPYDLAEPAYLIQSNLAEWHAVLQRFLIDRDSGKEDAESSDEECDALAGISSIAESVDTASIKTAPALHTHIRRACRHLGIVYHLSAASIAARQEYANERRRAKLLKNSGGKMSANDITVQSESLDAQVNTRVESVLQEFEHILEREIMRHREDRQHTEQDTLMLGQQLREDAGDNDGDEEAAQLLEDRRLALLNEQGVIVGDAIVMLRHGLKDLNKIETRLNALTKAYAPLRELRLLKQGRERQWRLSNHRSFREWVFGMAYPCLVGTELLYRVGCHAVHQKYKSLFKSPIPAMNIMPTFQLRAILTKFDDLLMRDYDAHIDCDEPLDSSSRHQWLRLEHALLLDYSLVQQRDDILLKFDDQCPSDVNFGSLHRRHPYLQQLVYPAPDMQRSAQEVVNIHSSNTVAANRPRSTFAAESGSRPVSRATASRPGTTSAVDEVESYGDPEKEVYYLSTAQERWMQQNNVGRNDSLANQMQRLLVTGQSSTTGGQQVKQLHITVGQLMYAMYQLHCFNCQLPFSKCKFPGCATIRNYASTSICALVGSRGDGGCFATETRRRTEVIEDGPKSRHGSCSDPAAFIQIDNGIDDFPHSGDTRDDDIVPYLGEIARSIGGGNDSGRDGSSRRTSARRNVTSGSLRVNDDNKTRVGTADRAIRGSGKSGRLRVSDIDRIDRLRGTGQHPIELAIKRYFSERRTIFRQRFPVQYLPCHAGIVLAEDPVHQLTLDAVALEGSDISAEDEILLEKRKDAYAIRRHKAEQKLRIFWRKMREESWLLRTVHSAIVRVEVSRSMQSMEILQAMGGMQAVAEMNAVGQLLDNVREQQQSLQEFPPSPAAPMLHEFSAKGLSGRFDTIISAATTASAKLSPHAAAAVGFSTRVSFLGGAAAIHEQRNTAAMELLQVLQIDRSAGFLEEDDGGDRSVSRKLHNIDSQSRESHAISVAGTLPSNSLMEGSSGSSVVSSDTFVSQTLQHGEVENPATGGVNVNNREKKQQRNEIPLELLSLLRRGEGYCHRNLLSGAFSKYVFDPYPNQREIIEAGERNIVNGVESSVAALSATGRQHRSISYVHTRSLRRDTVQRMTGTLDAFTFPHASHHHQQQQQHHRHGIHKHNTMPVEMFDLLVERLRLTRAAMIPNYWWHQRYQLCYERYEWALAHQHNPLAELHSIATSTMKEAERRARRAEGATEESIAEEEQLKQTEELRRLQHDAKYRADPDVSSKPYFRLDRQHHEQVAILEDGSIVVIQVLQGILRDASLLPSEKRGVPEAAIRFLPGDQLQQLQKGLTVLVYDARSTISRVFVIEEKSLQRVAEAFDIHDGDYALLSQRLVDAAHKCIQLTRVGKFCTGVLFSIGSLHADDATEEIRDDQILLPSQMKAGGSVVDTESSTLAINNTSNCQRIGNNYSAVSGGLVNAQRWQSISSYLESYNDSRDEEDSFD